MTMILAFLDDSDGIYHLLKSINHSTRYYLHLSDGLKAQLVPGPISILKEAISNDDLSKVTQYQHLDIYTILKKL